MHIDTYMYRYIHPHTYFRFCNCRSECVAACSCRNSGMFCNATCGTCNGDNYPNCPLIMDEKEEEEELESGDES